MEGVKNFLKPLKTANLSKDYELLELHECWMGRKHIVLEIEDYELLEWH